MDNSEQLINNISKGKNLSFEESKTAFLNIMSGNMGEDLIYKFLVNLSAKGETAEEIAGGVHVLREKALKVNASQNIIDTLELARDKFPGSPVNLDALCKRFRVDNSRRTKHTALMDCELLSKVYINLIDQKEPTLNFKLEEKEKADISLGSFSYCKKIIYPTKEEINNHKQYLKSTFKKNFF